METIWEIIERQLHAVAAESAHQAAIFADSVTLSSAADTVGQAETYARARNALVARAMDAIKSENEAIVTQLQAARNEQELEQYRACEMQRQQSNLTPLYRNAHEAGDQ